MKTRIQWPIGNPVSPRRSVLLLVLALALPIPSFTGAATNRTAPVEKGAAGLMVKACPAALPSEAEDSHLASLAAGWNGLAPEPLPVRTVRSNQVAQLTVHRVRSAAGRPILVLLHGVLSDHETWRFVSAALAGEYELWLVDLPGCGQSEPLQLSRFERDAYSLDAMGERVLQALEWLLAQVETGQRVTLVGHSLGGSIVIRMLSSPQLQARHAEVWERVNRAVLLAPCDLAVNSVPVKFISVLELQKWMLTVGDILGVTDGRLRDVVRTSYQRPECATIEQEQHFGHILKTRVHLEASKNMLLQAVPFETKTLRPQWEAIDPLVAEYANIRVPVLILFGERDETLAASMGNKLKDEIPGAVLVKLPRRGHALPTEDPEVCSMLIRWFAQGAEQSDLLADAPLKIYRSFGAVPPSDGPPAQPTSGLRERRAGR